ncbi:MAG: fliE [Solirubrobacterales bacterium]|nr:fliE [Solirubrobacterales bacterium]
MPLVPGIGAVGGSEWQIGGLEGTADGPTGRSFGSVLADQLQSLAGMQDTAAAASQSLADGTATDPTAVVMAVERARLSMQMASQMRTKGVEAINDIFHTQV